MGRKHRTVSIPQSGFRPCGRSCRPPARASSWGFNPSVGIPSMWTPVEGYLGKYYEMFQSLSRDSVHVDVALPPTVSSSLAFQSLSRDSVHVDAKRAEWGRQNKKVSIPQSGFRPCGRIAHGVGQCASMKFQSLSRDSVHVDLSASAGYWPSTLFQSLSRDSVHVDQRR